MRVAALSGMCQTIQTMVTKKKTGNRKEKRLRWMEHYKGKETQLYGRGTPRRGTHRILRRTHNDERQIIEQKCHFYSRRTFKN